jgi:hypothetical protein
VYASDIWHLEVASGLAGSFVGRQPVTSCF